MALYENNIEITIKQLRSSYESLTFEKRQRIDDYLLGAIRACSNLREGKSFSAAEMVGKNHTNWSSSPLNALREYWMSQYDNDEKKADDQAGKDVGHIVKHLMIDDKTTDYEIKGHDGYGIFNPNAYSIKPKK